MSFESPNLAAKLLIANCGQVHFVIAPSQKAIFAYQEMGWKFENKRYC